ncbi:MAG: hypothetical protein ACR2MX_11720 [Cyclobacteriaceae bacterium]
MQYGWEEQDFAFVKKRGRVHVIEQSSKKHFSYFRKKETSLNPKTLQWEDSSYFKYQQEDQPERVVKDWPTVVQKMNLWFKSLD